jgi:hypothetical protein
MGMRSSARRRRRRSSAIVHRRSAPAAKHRRGIHRVGAAMSERKHLTGALLCAAGLGFAKKQGYEIPHIGAVGEAGTIALAAWALPNFGIYRARWLNHLATAAGAIAVYEAVSTGNIPLLSSKKKTEGDEIDGAYDAR